jgi:hypothetical protein
MPYRGVLTLLRAIFTGAVAPLGGDIVFDTEFMADKMYRHPVGQVLPSPTEHQFANRGVFREKNLSFPCRRGFSLSGLFANRGACGICDIAPRAYHFHVYDFHFISLFVETYIRRYFTPILKSKSVAIMHMCEYNIIANILR